MKTSSGSWLPQEADGGLHNMGIGISTTSTGLTIHCSQLDSSEAGNQIMAALQVAARQAEGI